MDKFLLAVLLLFQFDWKLRYIIEFLTKKEFLEETSNPLILSLHGTSN